MNGTDRPSVQDLMEMYRRMLVIRGFEERVSAMDKSGEVPGFVHLSTGQEASAVGACWPLQPHDVITSTHRGHGHCLAKGLDPRGMFAELMARDSGTNRGRGGSMHIADPTMGIFGANGIVGAGLPIAVGAAAAARLREDGGIAVAFFGDGAVAQGAFHEAVNLAAVWGLPVVFWCENNGYAEFSPQPSKDKLVQAIKLSKRKDTGEESEEAPYLAGRYQCEVFLDGEGRAPAEFNVRFPPCPSAQIVARSQCLGFYEDGRQCPAFGASSREPDTCTCQGLTGWSCQ